MFLKISTDAQWRSVPKKHNWEKTKISRDAMTFPIAEYHQLEGSPLLRCTMMPFLKKRSRHYPRPPGLHTSITHTHGNRHTLYCVEARIPRVIASHAEMMSFYHGMQMGPRRKKKKKKNKDRRHGCHPPIGVTTLHFRVPILSSGDVVRWKMLDGETSDAHRSEGKVWRSIDVLSLAPHACFKCRSFPGRHSCVGGFVKLRHKPAIVGLPHGHINCGRLVQEQESAKCFGFLESLLFYLYMCIDQLILHLNIGPTILSKKLFLACSACGDVISRRQGWIFFLDRETISREQCLQVILVDYFFFCILCR